MREIIQLNQRLRKVAKGCLPDDGLMLEREDVPEELKAMPEQSRQEIDDLRSALNSLIPDDFDYLLCLGGADPALMLQYNNGSMTSAGRGHDWNNQRRSSVSFGKSVV